jgi:hypothetical protein
VKYTSLANRVRLAFASCSVQYVYTRRAPLFCQSTWTTYGWTLSFSLVLLAKDDGADYCQGLTEKLMLTGRLVHHVAYWLLISDPVHGRERACKQTERKGQDHVGRGIGITNDDDEGSSGPVYGSL